MVGSFTCASFNLRWDPKTLKESSELFKAGLSSGNEETPVSQQSPRGNWEWWSVTFAFHFELFIWSPVVYSVSFPSHLLFYPLVSLFNSSSQKVSKNWMVSISFFNTFDYKWICDSNHFQKGLVLGASKLPLDSLFIKREIKRFLNTARERDNYFGNSLLVFFKKIKPFTPFLSIDLRKMKTFVCTETWAYMFISIFINDSTKLNNQNIYHQMNK